MVKEDLGTRCQTRVTELGDPMTDDDGEWALQVRSSSRESFHKQQAV